MSVRRTRQPRGDTGATGPAATWLLDYAEITSPVAITGTSGSPTTIVTGNAITYDGSTRVRITFFCARLDLSLEGANTDGSLTFQLWDSTQIGLFGTFEWFATSAGQVSSQPIIFQRVLVPSAGSHTFAIKASADSNNNDGNSAVQAGAGGLDTRVPAFLLVERCA
jgi:hypothetical protein